MHYKNIKTGADIYVNSEISAPNYVRIDGAVTPPNEPAPEPVKEPDPAKEKEELPKKKQPAKKSPKKSTSKRTKK